MYMVVFLFVGTNVRGSMIKILLVRWDVPGKFIGKWFDEFQCKTIQRKCTPLINAMRDTFMRSLESLCDTYYLYISNT